ncbi:hypothetical protein BDY21DRAFT_410125 [Lineolata rhizophorae]|uniref:Uncharacterized protein n=1 Tax=Lineolata rhizophorae TaxID=578093 RepID=A0A6A6P539_9PEZI|nr:hypothetical protein BDY21DRAFT_410125 [Lineolata rhizophorae]
MPPTSITPPAAEPTPADLENAVASAPNTPRDATPPSSNALPTPSLGNMPAADNSSSTGSQVPMGNASNASTTSNLGPEANTPQVQTLPVDNSNSTDNNSPEDKTPPPVNAPPNASANQGSSDASRSSPPASDANTPLGRRAKDSSSRDRTSAAAGRQAHSHASDATARPASPSANHGGNPQGRQLPQKGDPMTHTYKECRVRRRALQIGRELLDLSNAMKETEHPLADRFRVYIVGWFDNWISWDPFKVDVVVRGSEACENVYCQSLTIMDFVEEVLETFLYHITAKILRSQFYQGRRDERLVYADRALQHRTNMWIVGTWDAPLAIQKHIEICKCCIQVLDSLDRAITRKCLDLKEHDIQGGGTPPPTDVYRDILVYVKELENQQMTYLIVGPRQEQLKVLVDTWKVFEKLRSPTKSTWRSMNMTISLRPIKPIRRYDLSESRGLSDEANAYAGFMSREQRGDSVVPASRFY